MNETVLFPFQREGVDRIHALGGRCLLGDSMGLGKTIQVLTYIKECPDKRPVLIVCPASLKRHWQQQAMQHLGMRVEILEGRTPPEWLHNAHEHVNSSLVAVCNYDLLDALVPFLVYLYPKIVVADESQAFGNPRALRTRAMRSLLQRAKVPHFIAVSGTPVTNRPIEFWPTLNMIDPKKFPSFHSFGHRYGAAKRTPWGWNYNGASRIDELYSLLTESYMIRRLKKDVLKDLPDKQRNVVPLDIEKPSEYKKAEREFATWLRQNYGNKVADKALRAEALARTNYLKRLAGKLKLKGLKEWVANFIESGEKLILFCAHRDLVDEFAKEYAGRCAVVTGGVKNKDRQGQFDKFNKDPDCRLFVATNAAVSGWSANSCSTVAFAELWWGFGTHLQGEDRIHGINRGMDKFISQSFYLIASETIEEKICNIVVNKSKTLDCLLDGKVVEDMGAFDEFLKSFID